MLNVAWLLFEMDQKSIPFLLSILFLSLFACVDHANPEVPPEIEPEKDGKIAYEEVQNWMRNDRQPGLSGWRFRFVAALRH